MARARTIKPGLMTNEDLCDLGPYAYILFTSLWMLADRDGRLEDRPKRIKAEAMPLWEDVSSETVENLVENLWKTGFIHRYEVDGKRYIQITNWEKHQHPHPREARSKIPPPPLDASVNGSGSQSYALDMPGHVEGNAFTQKSPSGSSGSSGSSCPPPFGRRTARARRAKTPSDKTADPTPKTEPEPRQPPEPRPKVRSANGVDFWPHSPQDVALIRDTLTQLAEHVRLPPPDDELVRRVLDVGRGARGEQIHAALVSLFQRQKFREMRSWGFVPLVIGQWFKQTGVN